MGRFLCISLPLVLCLLSPRLSSAVRISSAPHTHTHPTNEKKEYACCLKTKEKQIFATGSLIIFKSFVFLLCVSVLLQLSVVIVRCMPKIPKTLVIIYCKVGVGIGCVVGFMLNNHATHCNLPRKKQTFSTKLKSMRGALNHSPPFRMRRKRDRVSVCVITYSIRVLLTII